jgi:Capsule polysaccharide biosynthesis protein
VPSLDQLRQLGRKGNLEPGAGDRLAARIRRPADRIYELRATRLGELDRLAADISSTPASAPRVLVASLRGWPSHSACELVLAHALRLRGAEVALLTCGGGMAACEVGWARRAYPRPCDRCGWLTDRLARGSGVEHFALKDYFAWGADARRAPTEPPAGVADPYRRSEISLMWLIRATRIERQPDGLEARADFGVASAGVQSAAAAILEEFRPEVVFLLNGLFGAERTIRELALERGLRAPTYEIAPRAGTIVLSQDTPAPYYDTDAVWRQKGDQALTQQQRAAVVRLLKDRARGVGAHERYFEAPEQEHAELRRRLGLSDQRRTVSLFTNLSWDSATVSRDVGFSSMFEWITQSVQLAGRREDVVLVVRIHPAEHSWGTREEVEAEVLDRLGSLPDNVRIVPAAEALSSYALVEISDLVLTYTTTVGLEAATRGKPVAVAGETHYRRRGFTIDVSSAADLATVLADPPGPLDEAQVELALRYAFTFFFRSMIPFPAVQSSGGWVTHVPRAAAEIAPGADPHLDWICERVLDGGEFTLPDELAISAPPAAAGSNPRGSEAGVQ